MGRIIDRRRVMGGESLPYDAEIEYLESSGTQYIDTGFKDVSDCVFDVQYSILGFKDVDSNAVAFGTRELPRNIGVFSNLQSKNIVSDFQNTSSTSGYRVTYSGSFSIGDIIRVLSDIKDAYIFINEIQVLHSTRIITSTFNLSKSITLFKLNGTTWILYPIRVYRFKVIKNNDMIIDMFPVRIGTTGYMYDRVSGQLFGNSGTGDFILGPDKVRGGAIIINLMPYFGERRAA